MLLFLVKFIRLDNDSNTFLYFDQGLIFVSLLVAVTVDAFPSKRQVNLHYFDTYNIYSYLAFYYVTNARIKQAYLDNIIHKNIVLLPKKYNNTVQLNANKESIR